MDGFQNDKDNSQELTGIRRIAVLGIIGMSLGISPCTGDTSEKIEETNKMEQARKNLQERRMKKILDPGLDLVTRQIEIEYLLRSMGEEDAYEAIKKIMASKFVSDELAKFAMKNMDMAGSEGACYLIAAMVPDRDPEVIMHATETFNRVLQRKVLGEGDISETTCFVAVKRSAGNAEDFISGNYLFIVSNLLEGVQDRMRNTERGSKEWWQLRSAADNLMHAKRILKHECPNCEVDMNCSARMDRPTKFRVSPSQMQIPRRAPAKVARSRC